MLLARWIEGQRPIILDCPALLGVLPSNIAGCAGTGALSLLGSLLPNPSQGRNMKFRATVESIFIRSIPKRILKSPRRDNRLNFGFGEWFLATWYQYA